MIKITRPTKVPPSLETKNVKQTEEKIKAIVDKDGKAPEKAFTPLWQVDTFRQALWEMQHHKCCYCEKTVYWKLEMDVEHFRPKSAVFGESSHPGYWWLAYKWENLFLACKVCNSIHKGSKFPLMAESARAIRPDDCCRESPLLLHPCEDDPEEWIDWRLVRKPDSAGSRFLDPVVLVYASSSTLRGYMTLETLGLNRVQLLDDRAKHVSIIEQLVDKLKLAHDKGRNDLMDEAIEEIIAETDPSMPYAAMKRYIVRQAGFGRFLSGNGP